MASTRITAPVRGVTYQLSRLSIRHDARPHRCNKCLSTPFARSITTSTPSRATVSPIVTTIPADYVPIKPLEEQTVLATIHQFPSLEPLRFETYPANHLYLPTRKDILHRAVIYEGDMTRLGTASTKTRHEIRGSARKIRPQKGSGRARLGDKKSHMLRGGGVAFGPKPRDFATDLPKKVYDLAWRTALSYRFRKGELIIVDNAMEIESPSTRLLDDVFKHHERLHGRGRSLLVTLDERPLLEEALVRMDRGSQTLTWEEVDVKNLLELSRVIIERDALHNILLTHEEDLTHTPLTPWHKSLIKSNPPLHLEEMIGWAEFRDLQLLDPKDQETSRAAAYESVAAKRYAHASTLPESSPKRADMTISVYNLTAEAKMMAFTQHTGMPWAQYASDAYNPKRSFDDITAHRADIVTAGFPAIQAIEYQINLKKELAEDAAQTDRTQAEELELEVAQLEIRKAKVLHKAALLAAQVHEHIAEARRLAGDATEADLQIAIASHERSEMDTHDDTIMQTELDAAKLKLRVLTKGGALSEEMQKATGVTKEIARARKRIGFWKGRIDEKEREMTEEEEELEDDLQTHIEQGVSASDLNTTEGREGIREDAATIREIEQEEARGGKGKRL